MMKLRLPIVGLVMAAAGCAQTPPAPQAAAPDRPDQAGIATWYGERHNGRRTASGEIFDMNAMTAAHRDLPFGTQLKVTNVANGQSTQVRITDHCACNNSVIDLSKGAARAIGIPTDGGGTGRVRLDQI
jgi:rare lipoprotein A